MGLGMDSKDNELLLDNNVEVMPIDGRGRIVVIGNEKGGTGKSTTAMHLAVGALREGLRVKSVDLDAGQASFSRYVGNRVSFADEHGVPLVAPDHHPLLPSEADSKSESETEDRERLGQLLVRLAADCDVVVVDCPGSDTILARNAIPFADTLVTPINDSFVDLDLLAKFDGDPPAPVGPSRYSETVWEARKERARRGGAAIDWVVLRNRVSSLPSRNQRSVEAVLDNMSPRFGFRVSEGFRERVVFRELFLQGLTVLDLREEGSGVTLNMSHVAARQEVRRLLDFIGLEKPLEPAMAADGTAHS